MTIATLADVRPGTTSPNSFERAAAGADVVDVARRAAQVMMLEGVECRP
jgi:hypothetical protein